MRFLLVVVLACSAMAQSGPRIQISHTTESLRGVSAVSRQIAWASGTHGTYLRTVDGGRTWTPAHVPDAATLDFRGVVAFSSDEAFLMSSGPGEQSRIYHTSDAGKHWQLQFTNNDPKGFFDSIAFWDAKHGVVLGDPIADESGKLKFKLLQTEDGQSWHGMPSAQLPEAAAGEGAFASSNSCLALLPNSDDRNLWFATGGTNARVFHSPDRGQNWQVFDTPVMHGADSTGIFSIAFRDPLHGVIAGGDYKHPRKDGPNLALTDDGGNTWNLASITPQAYFSAVAFDQRVNQAAVRQKNEMKAAESTGKKIRVKPISPERLFIIGEDFIFDFELPNNPHRIGGKKKQGYAFNAVSPYPEGGALIVGPKGTIAFVP
jgi:photosystem II stability/assembly factor-like uncharacterized protein